MLFYALVKNLPRVAVIRIEVKQHAVKMVLLSPLLGIKPDTHWIGHQTPRPNILDSFARTIQFHPAARKRVTGNRASISTKFN